MCEVLIRKHDLDDDRQKGDIIFIAPDGHKWGKRETLQAWLEAGENKKNYPNDFDVIKIPQVTVDNFKKKMISSFGAAGENTHKIDTKNISKTSITKLNKNLPVVMTTADVLNVGKIRKSVEQKSKEEFQKTNRFLQKDILVKTVKAST